MISIIRKMRVLVLGSHGTIGREVCVAFSDKGHDVIQWDLKMGPEYDLRIPRNLDEILNTIDFAIFLAFDVGGSKYNASSIEYMNNNLQIIYNTFDSLKRFNTPFIHTTSTMSSMTHTSYGPIKRLAEFYTEFLGGVNIKVWNVYGEEDIGDKSHVINDLIYQAVTTDYIHVMTNGVETRNFLFAEDFAKGLYSVFESYSEFSGKCVDIANTESVSIKAVAYTIKSIANRVLKKKISLVFADVESTAHTMVNYPNVPITDRWWPLIHIEDGIEKLMRKMILSM
jgi:nucleoside-diphosphate-sugar epimerase